MSPSPVQSTTVFALTTSGPLLVSKITPSTPPSPTTPLAKAWNSMRTPAWSSSSSATHLNSSGSNGTTYPVSSEGATAPPLCTSRSSSSLSTPAMTGWPGPWSLGSRLVTPSFSKTGRWVWNDIKGMTSAAVALPPRKPYRSTRITSAPARAAPSAAPMPDGPPPTTSTSVSAARPARRAGRVSSGMVAGFWSMGMSVHFLAWSGRRQAVEQVHEQGMVLARPFLQRRQSLADVFLDLGPEVPRVVDRGEQLAGADVVQGRCLHVQGLEQASHLGRIRQRHERYALQRGEDQEVQPHADAELEAAHDGHQLAGAVLALQYCRVLGVLHARHHGMAVLQVLVAALQRNENHIGVEALHHEVS